MPGQFGKGLCGDKPHVSMVARSQGQARSKCHHKSVSVGPQRLLRSDIQLKTVTTNSSVAGDGRKTDSNVGRAISPTQAVQVFSPSQWLQNPDASKQRCDRSMPVLLNQPRSAGCRRNLTSATLTNSQSSLEVFHHPYWRWIYTIPQSQFVAGPVADKERRKHLRHAA